MDTPKTARNENSFKIMILIFILLENVIKYGFRTIISQFVIPNLVPVEPTETGNEK